jgi:hypothetical protein
MSVILRPRRFLPARSVFFNLDRSPAGSRRSSAAGRPEAEALAVFDSSKAAVSNTAPVPDTVESIVRYDAGMPCA